jgi:hypothetical protein
MSSLYAQHALEHRLKCSRLAFRPNIFMRRIDKCSCVASPLGASKPLFKPVAIKPKKKWSKWRAMTWDSQCALIARAHAKVLEERFEIVASGVPKHEAIAGVDFCAVLEDVCLRSCIQPPAASKKRDARSVALCAFGVYCEEKEFRENENYQDVLAERSDDEGSDDQASSSESEQESGEDD